MPSVAVVEMQYLDAIISIRPLHALHAETNLLAFCFWSSSCPPLHSLAYYSSPSAPSFVTFRVRLILEVQCKACEVRNQPC